MEIVARPSPNHDSRPDGVPVDILVLHYTGMQTFEAALDRLSDPAAKVSAHYAIGRDGVVNRLVDEDRRAWHAGASSWRGQSDINGRSIGIELENKGHEFGYEDFPQAQMTALIELASGILSRHPIPARNVVGHSDVAPARKEDPGEKFDWPALAAAGIGLLPTLMPGDLSMADRSSDEAFLRALTDYGYDISDQPAAIRAFHRHFRSRDVEGPIDADSWAIVKSLIQIVA